MPPKESVQQIGGSPESIMSAMRIGALRSMLFPAVTVLLFVGGCDYWAPPLQVKMIEDGGAFVLW